MAFSIGDITTGTKWTPNSLKTFFLKVPEVLGPGFHMEIRSRSTRDRTAPLIPFVGRSSQNRFRTMPFCRQPELPKFIDAQRTQELRGFSKERGLDSEESHCDSGSIAL